MGEVKSKNGKLQRHDVSRPDISLLLHPDSNGELVLVWTLMMKWEAWSVLPKLCFDDPKSRYDDSKNLYLR